MKSFEILTYASFHQCMPSYFSDFRWYQYMHWETLGVTITADRNGYYEVWLTIDEERSEKVEVVDFFDFFSKMADLAA